MLRVLGQFAEFWSCATSVGGGVALKAIRKG